VFGLRDWEMPDNRKGDLGASSAAKAALLAVLAVLLAIPAALYVIPVVQAAGTHSAWLKIVTPSWNGVDCTPLITPQPSTPRMKACPGSTTGFADRYNLTGQWYWVEVYQERGAPFNDAVFYGKFYPNGTGFAKISWPDTWANLTVVVKAKSYDGTEVGAGTLYSGIIVYALVVNASPTYLSQKTGIPITGVFNPPVSLDNARHNATILMTGNGYIVPYGSSWAALLGTSFSRSGPIDSLALHPNQFATAFSDPRNAWVANASVIFKHFHVHTWYSVKDNLSYAQVKIYEMNITTGGASLIRAFVTKGDGSGNSLYDPRTTGEMYPAHDRYANNELVPIPVQAVNIVRKLPYGVWPNSPTMKWAHLNVTVRVWWETVLVNTTFYAGHFGAGDFPASPVGPTNRGYRSILTMSYSIPVLPSNPPAILNQPLSIYYNFSTAGYVERDTSYPPSVETVVGASNFLNSTVFYWRCGVRDDDLMVNGTVYDPNNFGWGFRTFNSSLFLATCKFNLRDKDGNAYYLQNQVGTTEQPFVTTGDIYALTNNPHAWPGYLPQFRSYLRVPNATMWTGLAAKYADIVVFADGKSAVSEVYTSRYYTGTADLTTPDPTKVAVDGYLKTRSISDDPGPYNGLRIEIQYSGGFMDSYGGASQTVGVFTLRNPYLVALKNLLQGWPDPWVAAVTGNYPEIYSGNRATPPRLVRLGISSNGGPLVGRVETNTVSGVNDPIFGSLTFYPDGKLLLVANVSDIVFTFRDNEGNVLDPSDVEAFLLRENGAPVKLLAYRLVPAASTADRYAYEQVGPVSWPFLWRLNISVSLLGSPAPTYVWVAFQVPEDLMYGIRVKFAGVTIYDNPGEINKLVQTEFVDKTISVFKLKVLFVDCRGRPLAQTPAWMIDPATGSEVRFNTGSDGAKDFIVTGGTLTFTRLYWKGVDVPFLEAELPDGTKIPATGGKVEIPVSGDYHAPIKVKALIEDFKFKTWDFQGTFEIPRLNVTISWVGYNISDPLRRPWYFLETMDPRPYAIPDGTLAERLGVVPSGQGAAFDAQRWNTSVRVAQFFSYVIQHVNNTNEYIFYQMPPAVYNITVTTVVPISGFSDSASPGFGFWPGETGDRAYESTIVWRPGSSSMLPREEHAGALTRVVLREFNRDLRFTQCGVVAVDLKTWALHWFLEMIDADLRIGDVSFDIINDNFQSMTLGLGNSTGWDKLTLEYKSVLYGDNSRPGPQDFSYLWWNGSYRLVDVRLTTNMSFTVDKFYNSSALPNKVWPALNFTIQPSETLHKQQTTYSDWLDLQKDFGYKIIIYDKETLRAPLPVTFVKPRAVDKGGSPLEKALIEAWILDLDTSKRVRIDGADTGSGEADGLQVTWTWELKRVADPDTPQRFKMVRWDRVYLTFTAAAPPPPPGEPIEYGEDDTFSDLGITAGTTVHFVTSANIHVDFEEFLTLQFHTAGTITVIEEYGTFFNYITVKPGDIITFTGSFSGNGIDIGIPPSMRATVVEFSDPDYIWFHNDGRLLPEPEVPTPPPVSKTILVQVPPYPAKLYLRDVVGDFDIVVTARDVTVLVDDEDDTPDGLLSYGQWETDATGHLPSFTLPEYKGMLLLPTSGWLAATYADDPEVEEFHYQFNVVWKSAVVYSDNLVLDKKPVVFGASEVYDVTFLYTLSNSTNPADAVRNLNLWIYYPNVTRWHSDELWHEVPPTPQDYEPCKDSDFPCRLRVTLISSADADGVVSFAKTPGPRFMNTTWKYVFSANHSAITWMKDLVATQFVLNNETFGDGPLKTVTTSRITVPIMLNAAHQLRFLVLGWRDEQGQPTAYPLEGFTVRYEIRRRDAALTVASGTATSTAEGTAEIRSDPTDPRKVLWAGLTVRYRVEPPSWLVNPADAKWPELVGARGVQVVPATGYTPDARPSIGAYYPDEVPTHFAITEISTRFVDGWCFGLCTAYIDGRQQSKPYIINVDYTIVTVRALDFNGRPLRGAFVEIVERASGRVAGWSYTFGATWKRQPVDLITLYDFHRVQLLPARDVGGDGYTEFMPVAVGPWNYDANNDDRVDATGYRGDDPRTPAIEGTPLQFIVRVYWLATDELPEDASGDLRAIWPFIDPQKPWSTTEAGVPVRKSHVKVYDSDFDETDAAAKTLLVPIDSTVTIRKPSDVIWKYNGAHRDVTTAVFDFKALLNYEGKTLPDSIKNRIEVWVYRKTGAVTELALRFRAGPTIDTVTVNRLPRGVYEIEVRFIPTGAAIFRRTFDISVVNVGTVQAEAALPFTDLSFEVTDMKGRPLPIAPEAVRVEPADVYDKVSVAGNVVTIGALYTGAPVTITVSYSSPVYGTSADVRVTDTADGLKARLLGGRTLQLPVDDVTVTVVDRKGQPMGGAVVKLGAAPAKSTGGDGRAVFERVPLESAGRGITYSLSVSVGGVEVTPADARSVELSTARTSVTVIGELFSLPVRVIGTLGQGLAGANVRVVKGAVTVASASTDQGGFAQFDRLVLDTYTVVANYKGYTQEVSVSSADLQAGKVVEITLPIYTELLGIPMPLSTLLALIIGLILLVVVIAIIVSEYRWWRGRRLGVYPPAPPKPPK